MYLLSAMSTNGESGKRDMPGWLRRLLDQDVRASKQFYEHFDRKYGLVNYRNTLKYLEYSCHGILWFCITFVLIYSFPTKLEFSVNLLVLLIIDIIIVALVKVGHRKFRKKSF